MRIGHGFDVHRFGDGDHVMLGGVRIACDQGLVAHSDGDVLLHALCDALLGAAGLGDIGQHFPDTDARYAGADSRELTRQVCRRIAAAGWRIVNCDVTVIAQKPRLAEWRDAIRASVAGVLAIDDGCVNIKATTTERLGFTGRGEGIAVEAVCLLDANGADSRN